MNEGFSLSLHKRGRHLERVVREDQLDQLAAQPALHLGFLFSDEFFTLALNQKAEMNRYLTFDEPVTMELDGKVYRFEKAEK